MENNFTNDIIYRNSLYYRFNYKKIKSLKSIDLIRYYDGLNCFQYFEFNITEEDIQDLIKINKKNDIKFRYIDENSNIYKILSQRFIIKKTDEWYSPIIEIKKNNFQDYVQSKSNNFKRLIKKCQLYNKQIKVVKSNKNNINNLFKDVLLVDQKSWKAREKSDMFNLDNEQIIYLSMLKYCDIVVAYKYNTPIGYSLLIQYNNKYYAAKWGATDDGRKLNAGIICLLTQIKKISSNKDLYLDLWGRRNKIYDRMATSYKKRLYFSIIKNDNKKRTN